MPHRSTEITLRKLFPSAPIFGIFIARRVFPTCDLDVFLAGPKPRLALPAAGRRLIGFEGDRTRALRKHLIASGIVDPEWTSRKSAPRCNSPKALIRSATI